MSATPARATGVGLQGRHRQRSFRGVGAARRHRAIYAALAGMMATDIHALSIAADQRILARSIGITAVLHTWGSALSQNPHS